MRPEPHPRPSAPRSASAPGRRDRGAVAQIPPASAPPAAREHSDHGAHTLRVVRGTVVGLDRDDVFVDLGPRLQGVISAARFARAPALGDVYEFTLRGQEEGLWRLELPGAGARAEWEQMQPGFLVEARVTGLNAGGFEMKIGALHGFMPRSHSGLDRRDRPRTLLGRTLAVEVLEVDRERQRVLLSRKLVLRRERAGGRSRDAAALRPGQVVEGRVVRLLPFGALVRFGPGFEGLLHVSNLAHGRVEDPRQLLAVGESVTARILTVRADGKRISLGTKQLDDCPWPILERAMCAGAPLLGEVVRVDPSGLLVKTHLGVEGFVPRCELGLDPRAHLRQFHRVGELLSLRVLEADRNRDRLLLSRLHTDGSLIAPEEADVDPDLWVDGDREDWSARAISAAPVQGREGDGQPGRSVRLARELLRELREWDESEGGSTSSIAS